MSAQTSYSAKPSQGVAGGLYDLTEHIVDTRVNDAENEALLFGLGVVEGETVGTSVTLPTKDSTKAQFEGVIVNSHAHEMNFYGEVKLRKSETVGVLKSGRIYVRVVDDAEPKYGDPVYLITDGDYTGWFTNSADGYTAMKLKGYFLKGKESETVAPAQIVVDKYDSDSSDSGNTETP